jgi:hypothetical protein
MSANKKGQVDSIKIIIKDVLSHFCFHNTRVSEMRSEQ